MLVVLGSKPSPQSADIEKILSSAGIEIEGDKQKKVIDELNGISINELIAQRREKLSSMPAGGAAEVAAPAAIVAPAAVEEKKEGKQDSESDDDDMGFGLFD